MEPLSIKKPKLETTIASEQSSVPEDEPVQPVHTSVRQQLRDLLAEASAHCCGTPLPTEISDLIIECLFVDFSEIPDDVFDIEECQIQGGYKDYFELKFKHQEMMFRDPLRRRQLSAIINLPGQPFEDYGTEVQEVIDQGDMGVCWLQVGFPVGWKGSGEVQEFDIFFFNEVHHFYASFVFEKGSTEVLLRSDPDEFCKPVRHPERAKDLLGLCASLFWSLEYMFI